VRIKHAQPRDLPPPPQPLNEQAELIYYDLLKTRSESVYGPGDLHVIALYARTMSLLDGALSALERDPENPDLLTRMTRLCAARNSLGRAIGAAPVARHYEGQEEAERRERSNQSARGLVSGSTGLLF
jgi:hypothetical protein